MHLYALLQVENAKNIEGTCPEKCEQGRADECVYEKFIFQRLKIGFTFL